MAYKIFALPKPHCSIKYKKLPELDTVVESYSINVILNVKTN